MAQWGMRGLSIVSRVRGTITDHQERAGVGAREARRKLEM